MTDTLPFRDNPLKATIIDDDAFRLLAYPFTGPLDYPGTRGVDMDGQWFGPETDIRKDWLPARPVDWHHGVDGVMRRTVIGKAVDLGGFSGASNEPDEDGWWVTVWMNHGEARMQQIKGLVQRAQRLGKTAGEVLFGSSETIPGLATLRTSKGEVPWTPRTVGLITKWPYWRQTLSTSPQNTHSVIRPLKATLDDLDAFGLQPGTTFWSDIEAALRSLGPSLQVPSVSAPVAKAGRVLSAKNDEDLRAALAALEEAMARASSVLQRQPDYGQREETESQ